jgi:hypothetical protein
MSSAPIAESYPRFSTIALVEEWQCAHRLCSAPKRNLLKSPPSDIKKTGQFLSWAVYSLTRRSHSLHAIVDICSRYREARCGCVVPSTGEAKLSVAVTFP